MAHRVSFKCTICQDDAVIPEGESIGSIKKNTLAFEGSDALSESTRPVATKCNDLFHECCLKDWIDQYKDNTTAATCPNCRTELIPAAPTTVQLPQPSPNPAPSQLETTEYLRRTSGMEDEAHANFPPLRQAQYILHNRVRTFLLPQGERKTRLFIPIVTTRSGSIGLLGLTCPPSSLPTPTPNRENPPAPAPEYLRRTSGTMQNEARANSLPLQQAQYIHTGPSPQSSNSDNSELSSEEESYGLD